MRKLLIDLRTVMAFVFALTTAFTTAPKKVNSYPPIGFTLYQAVGPISIDIPVIDEDASAFWGLYEFYLYELKNSDSYSNVNPRVAEPEQEAGTYSEIFCIDDTSEELCLIVLEYQPFFIPPYIEVRDIIFGVLY